jgi:cobalt-zinc-cadmium efflux system membrane fusion protein
MTPSQLAQIARKRMAKLSRTPAAKTARTPLGMAVIGAVAVLLVVLAISFSGSPDIVEAEKAGQSRRVGGLYYPAEKQWGSLTIVPVSPRVFRSEHLTEGKIAIDEDRSTLVFSPYSGRVIKLLAKPGDIVTAGQPLFVVEAPDMVQAQNDFINALANLNKARSQLDYAKIVEQQNKTLYETRAAPLRDVQQSAAGSLAAQNDLRAADTALEVVRNRLRILGKTDEEITKFGETGAINPQTTIYSPIDGTVVQRKVGPGQYVNTTSNSPAANDATFIIGDLSTVWLVGYVRESEAPNVKVGQAVRFSVLAFPDRVFTANIAYVATALDAATRRLMVRATLNNKEGILRPEMFASVTILTSEGESSLAVPREAIVYDGQGARVWKTNDDRSVESRRITTGYSDGQFVQVLEGLTAGDKVIGKGSLFVDRDATGN